MFKSALMQEIDRRGLLHSCTAPQDLDALLADGERLTVYAGFDCTADSLHVGNLVTLRLLRLFKDFGHKVVPLIGSATTMIGDPSGKDAARPLLSSEQIRENSNGIKESIFRVIGETEDLEFNSDWTLGLNLVDFLRDVGRKVSVNRMLTLESVSRRLEGEEGISFLEFTYSLFQANDFLRLFENRGVSVQIGGSDQWGNIVMGTDLIRKTHPGAKVFGITHPLLTNSRGEKMGKSVKGAVWLNESKLSNFEFFQFWRNVDDAEVDRLLKLFVGVEQQPSDINDAKILLATEITNMVRGDGAGEQCARSAKILFTNGEGLSGIPEMSITVGQAILDLLVLSKLCTSKSDARRTIEQRGIKLNDVIVDDPTRVITNADLNSSLEAKLSRGKKNHVRLFAVL